MSSDKDTATAPNDNNNNSGETKEDIKDNEAAPKSEKSEAVASPAEPTKDDDGENNDDEEADGDGDKKKEKKKKAPMATFGSLFRFGDACDGFLVFIGAIGAIGVGGALPAFSVLFGDLVNEVRLRPDCISFLWFLCSSRMLSSVARMGLNFCLFYFLCAVHVCGQRYVLRFVRSMTPTPKLPRRVSKGLP